MSLVGVTMGIMLLFITGVALQRARKFPLRSPEERQDHKPSLHILRNCWITRSRRPCHGRDVGMILIGDGLAQSYHCGATRCPARRSSRGHSVPAEQLFPQVVAEAEQTGQTVGAEV